MPVRKILPIGSKFGMLTVVGDLVLQRDEKYNRNRSAYPVVCECGNEKVMRRESLVRAESCGCLGSAGVGKAPPNKKHGMGDCRIYKIWHGMISRCTIENHKSYERYGGRGISVCDQWQEFQPFHDWAMANGYTDELTIERIDNDGNYCPDNCRWATMIEQSRNKSNNVWVTAFDETKLMSDWVRDPRCVVCRGTVEKRMALGISPENAITLLAI